MLKHRLSLCLILLILHESVYVNPAQLGQLPVFIQKIANPHYFVFFKRNRNNRITMQVFGKYTAGNRIAVQSDHKIYNGCAVADFNTLVRNFIAEQILRKVRGFLGPLYKTQTWV